MSDYLKSQPAYTQHAPRRERYLKPFYSVPALYYLMEMDLFETGRIAHFNSGTRYILLCIEAASRKLFARTLPDKKGATVAKEIEYLIEHEFDQVPTNVRTDKGGEFIAKAVQNVLKKFNIRHVIAHNTEKASLIERSGATLLNRLHRALTFHNTLNFIPYLAPIIKSINLTEHSSTGVAPGAFTQRDLYRSWEQNYLRHVAAPDYRRQLNKRGRYAFKPGDHVRISTLRRSGLEKAYRGTYTNEVFVVIRRRLGIPPSYDIAPLHDTANPIEGRFFEPELIGVADEDDQMYPIDKVLSHRVNPSTGERECQVTWQGWPTSVKTWIPETHVVTTSQAQSNTTRPAPPSPARPSPATPRHTARAPAAATPHPPRAAAAPAPVQQHESGYWLRRRGKPSS